MFPHPSPKDQTHMRNFLMKTIRIVSGEESGILSDPVIYLFRNRFPYWVEAVQDSQYEMVNRLISFYQETGRMPTSFGEENKLYSFLQRMILRDNGNMKGIVFEETIAQLDHAIPSWREHSEEMEQQKQAEQIVYFYDLTGYLP